MPTLAHLRIATLSTSLLLLAHAVAATAEPTSPAGIQASGQCVKKVAHDRGSIVVSSSSVAPRSSEAAERTNKAHERVKREVAALGLKDAESETITYTVDEECTYENGKRSCRGYKATFATRFETSEIGRIGDIIDIASKSSSEQISELNTFVSPTTVRNVQESCLEIASKNAARKAEKLAAGAGVKLGKLLSLTEISSPTIPGGPPVIQRYGLLRERGAPEMAAASAPEITSKPTEIEVLVRATYGVE